MRVSEKSHRFPGSEFSAKVHQALHFSDSLVEVMSSVNSEWYHFGPEILVPVKPLLSQVSGEKKSEKAGLGLLLDVRGMDLQRKITAPCSF